MVDICSSADQGQHNIGVATLRCSIESSEASILYELVKSWLHIPSHTSQGCLTSYGQYTKNIITSNIQTRCC